MNIIELYEILKVKKGDVILAINSSKFSPLIVENQLYCITKVFNCEIRCDACPSVFRRIYVKTDSQDYYTICHIRFRKIL